MRLVLVRRGKRGIGCRRRGDFIRVGSEYYHLLYCGLGLKVRADIGGVLVAGASRSLSMNGRWRRRRRLRGGRNNMGLGLSLQALGYRDIDSGGILYSACLSKCSINGNNHRETLRLMLSTHIVADARSTGNPYTLMPHPDQNAAG